tara:strand:- start:19605 stop:20483 length:879 start_codon:yes stop_codon:yes gene_type:complete
MKILVIGVGGFTGSYLFNAIKEEHEVIGTSTHNKDFMNLDLSQFDKAYKILEELNPDIICLPAGITNPDFIENHPIETGKVNVLGTKNISDFCKENKCKLIFFSSDAVFDGKNGPYSENDNPNPISEYGRQKLEAENFIKKLDNFVIIRTSSIYGWDKRNLNFVSRIINELKNNNEFLAPIDQHYTPTYVVDIANAVDKFIQKNLNGIYNFTGPDYLSRYDIAMNVCNIFGLKKGLVIPVKSDDLKQTAKRLKQGGLINKKAVKELGIRFKGIKEGLKDMSSDRNYSGHANT